MMFKSSLFFLTCMAIALFGVTPAVQASDIADPVECAEYDGRWSRFGNNDDFSCSLPTLDGGKACSNSDDCEAACVTSDDTPVGTQTEGHCYDWTVLNGTCMNYIENGVAVGVKCVQ